MKLTRSAAFQITLVVILAAAWKMVFFFWDVVPFNADEAVVGLMARHILLGERPVFFYGQAYMGSLDAFLVSAGFALFGPQVWVIRLVQMLLYLGTVLTTILIGRAAFNSVRAGTLAGLLLAVPTVNMTLYTTASLGGYGEALLIGNLMLLAALAIVRRTQAGARGFPWLLAGTWGLLVGGGLWANGLTLVYSAPTGVYILWNMWKCQREWLAGFLLVAAAGFFLGSLPWWAYAIAKGPDRLILELFGTAVAVEPDPWLLRTGKHAVYFLTLGLTVLFGLRPPWGVTWLGVPMLPFALLFWVGVLVFFTRRLLKRGSHQGAYALLAGVCGVLLAGFLFTPFGIDPSGRYFLPLAVPLALVGAQMILSTPSKWWQAVGITALVILYQLWGNLQCALRNPPGLTTQFYEPTIIDHRADGELRDFLLKEGETRGYSNYWVAYPLAFNSGEQLIFAPRLPYHLDLRYTPRDDRYPVYTRQVDNSERVAYITTRNPRLDQLLRERFQGLGVGWQEKLIGDYLVFYRLTRPVRPLEVGLGELRE